MKRLLSTIRLDVQLQFRNGFYYAAAFVAILSVLLLGRLPPASLTWFLPVLIVNNLIINNFYFMGGLVLLEKGEGTLEAQVVTPLRTGEYLASKAATLSLLSLLETVVIVSLTLGLDFNVFALIAGVVLTSIFFMLAGFIVVARYDSINEYLLPSVLYTALLSLPLLPYVGVGQSWLFYLHPLQGMLLLLQAAFRPLATWQLLYGLGYSLLWLALIYHLSQHTFHRFVITKEGTRRQHARGRST
ncbi:MAG TPA: ABC transporter permease [Anaerolineae bacterium]